MENKSFETILKLPYFTVFLCMFVWMTHCAITLYTMLYVMPAYLCLVCPAHLSLFVLLSDRLVFLPDSLDHAWLSDSLLLVELKIALWWFSTLLRESYIQLEDLTRGPNSVTVIIYFPVR